MLPCLVMWHCELQKKFCYFYITSSCLVLWYRLTAVLTVKVQYLELREKLFYV